MSANIYTLHAAGMAAFLALGRWENKLSNTSRNPLTVAFSSSLGFWYFDQWFKEIISSINWFHNLGMPTASIVKAEHLFAWVSKTSTYTFLNTHFVTWTEYIFLISKVELERERQGWHTERGHPSTGSLPKCSQWLQLDQVEARNPELHAVSHMDAG